MSEAPTILVTCEGSPNPHQRVKIARARRSTVTQGWVVVGGKLGPSGLPLAHDDRVTFEYVADGKAARSMTPAERESAEDLYRRYVLTCPRCHFPVQVKEERLNTILDTLAAADVSSITLHGVAARLRNG